MPDSSRSVQTPEHVRDSLRALAQNYSWVWNSPRKQLLVEAVGENWGGKVHPFSAVGDLTDEQVDALHADTTFVARLQAEASTIALLEAGSADAHATPDVGYFSPEFGVSETLPQYSGGLGILAGDHLKAVSDVGIPLVGVGLFYANGYFDQGMVDSQQSVSYQTYEPADLGLVDTETVVEVQTPRGAIRASVWLAKIGATRLYLMDTRVEGNDDWATSVTDRLYGGDQAHRVDQEWLLGIGGMRALRGLGIKPKTVHLNEGHAGFLLLELLADQLSGGASLEQAQAAVKAKTLFTTHTPVPAGIDRFPNALLRPYIDQWAKTLQTVHVGVADAVWANGELPSETEGDLFNMAAFCLRHAGMSNGVSALHGEVSQKLFGSLAEGANITSVTNGVHARTWMAQPTQDLLDRHIGSDFAEANEPRWQAAQNISDPEIRNLRSGLRQDLVHYLDAEHGVAGFDASVLTVGFARRFATYKRAALLLKEKDALIEMLNNDEAPVQFVFAGKAHPADKDGQRVFAEIAEFGASPEANGRFILVPGYDIAVALQLYGGCDVWLNNPVRPQEACGTSGEKSALNGGLNCSILDGWWAEWFHAENGWAIQTSEETNTDTRDAIEAKGLVTLLRDEVIPSFYADGTQDTPSKAWNQRIRFGWQYLGPRVTAARMVNDYNASLYQPLCER